MSITRTHPTSAPGRAVPVRGWRTVVGLAALAGGAAMIAGVFLPWAAAFAGLISIPGTRGSNGRILLAGGIIIAGAGLYHIVRGGSRGRWLIGLAGFASLAFSAYLLLRLTTTLQALGGSMDVVQGGPGLWVIAGGSLLAFATLFLPSSGQQAFRARPEAGTGLVAWAADRNSAGALRWLQMAIGVVWVLDAALQFQPYMFGSGFVTGVLEPSAMGSPAFVATPVMSYGQLILHNEVAFNAVFATVQLVLGLGLLWRRTVRAALAGTIVWALTVWWVGEGMGMIFSGTASPLTGAPGAALLYALLAALAWPARSPGWAGGGVAGSPGWAGGGVAGSPESASGGVAGSPGSAGGITRAGLRGLPGLEWLSGLRGLRGLPWARLAWLAVWGSGVFFVLQAANLAPGALRGTIVGLGGGEPGWIASMDRGVAAAIGSGGPAVSVALAVIFAVIAVGIFVPAATRPVLVLASVAAAVIWVLGENFGGILTGRGTDPNTGPLLILLAAAFWPRKLPSGVGTEPARAS